MISAGFTIALSRLTPLETLPAPCKMPLEKLSLSLLAMQWIFPGFCPQCRGLLQNSGKQTNLLQFPAGKSALPAGNSRERASVLSCVHRTTTAGVDKISEPSCSSEKGPQTLPRFNFVCCLLGESDAGMGIPLDPSLGMVFFKAWLSLCEIPPFSKLLCGKEEHPAPCTHSEAGFKNKELQKNNKSKCFQSCPSMLSTKAGAGRQCQVFYSSGTGRQR